MMEENLCAIARTYQFQGKCILEIMSKQNFQKPKSDTNKVVILVCKMKTCCALFLAMSYIEFWLCFVFKFIYIALNLLITTCLRFGVQTNDNDNLCYNQYFIQHEKSIDKNEVFEEAIDKKPEVSIYLRMM